MFLMKVLLVAPLDPIIPKNLKFLMGGENTFTRMLLANPPDGVDYIYFEDALRDGLVEYLPWQKFLSWLVKLRILPLSAGSQCFKILENFDLIHCHAYSIKIEGRKVPVILSVSSSNFLFLRDYLGWPLWRIKFLTFIKKVVFKNLEVLDSDTNLERAAKLIVFSNYASKIYQKLGAEKSKIEVIYPGLSRRSVSQKRRERQINILFAGVWFERKGGPLLLKAFDTLSSKYDGLRLTMLGPVPKKYNFKNLNIFQKDFVPYKNLLNGFYPRADIFVLVPPLTEGYGLVVEEAQSFGIPTIVSRICALPELVADGKTGFVIKPGSVNELVEKLEVLIVNQSLRKKMGEAAKKRFDGQFSIERSNEKLLAIYRQVLF